MFEVGPEPLHPVQGVADRRDDPGTFRRPREAGRRANVPGWSPCASVTEKPRCSSSVPTVTCASAFMVTSRRPASPAATEHLGGMGGVARAFEDDVGALDQRVARSWSAPPQGSGRPRARPGGGSARRSARSPGCGPAPRRPRERRSPSQTEMPTRTRPASVHRDHLQSLRAAPAPLRGRTRRPCRAGAAIPLRRRYSASMAGRKAKSALRMAGAPGADGAVIPRGRPQGAAGSR